MQALCMSMAALGCAAGSVFGQIEITHRPVPAPAEQWAITQVAGNGYATVGQAVVAGQETVVFSRHAANGAILFQRFLRSGRDDVAFCIQNTRDGGFVIAGETNSPGGANGFITLTKLDASGGFVWSRIMSGARFNDRPVGVGLRELSNGDYVIVARTLVAGIPGQFGTAAVFTPAGVRRWASVYRDPRYQTPFMQFADVREVRDAGGEPRLVVVGFSSRDNGAPREPIALLIDPATGANPLARSYDFFTPNEDAFANGLHQATASLTRITGRVTEPSIGAIVDDTVVFDVDAALLPVGVAIVYDNFKVAHAAIEPSFTAVGVSVLAGQYQATAADEDGMLVTLGAIPGALIWSNRYGNDRADLFRGLITDATGIVGAGATEGGAGNLQYEALTDPMGQTGCERRWQLNRFTSTPRSTPFECPRIEWEVRAYDLSDPRTDWVDRVTCKQCATDFNNDGFVDFFDYDEYVRCFETLRCPPGKDADFNGDGFVDFFDYDDFVTAFERGC